MKHFVSPHFKFDANMLFLVKLNPEFLSYVLEKAKAIQ